MNRLFEAIDKLDAFTLDELNEAGSTFTVSDNDEGDAYSFLSNHMDSKLAGIIWDSYSEEEKENWLDTWLGDEDPSKWEDDYGYPISEYKEHNENWEENAYQCFYDDVFKEDDYEYILDNLSDEQLEELVNKYKSTNESDDADKPVNEIVDQIVYYMNDNEITELSNNELNKLIDQYTSNELSKEDVFEIVDQLERGFGIKITESTDLTEDGNYELNTDDFDDVYISCKVDDSGDSILYIIPCLWDEENSKYYVSKNDINFIGDDGDEVYPDVDYDTIVNNIPKDILDSLSTTAEERLSNM